MTKEKPKSLFEKDEPIEHNNSEMAHEEHAEPIEHPEEDATGISPTSEEKQMHPALAILMNKLNEPEEDEPLMPHKVGGIKKNKSKG